MLPHKHDLGLGRRPPSRLFSLEAAAFICRFGDGLIRPHAPTSITALPSVMLKPRMSEYVRGVTEMSNLLEQAIRFRGRRASRRGELTRQLPHKNAVTPWIALIDDRSAELRESKKSEEGKDRLSKGEWRHDEATTQYAITINGETTSYSLFSTDDINTCMLFKGDIASADLRKSWFTTMGSADEYDK